MEDKVMQTYLYDFYGELLTKHQKEVYEEFVLHDLTLSEIAEEKGISRQGVHDLVKRCNKLLAGYEEKLHLLEKFVKTKQKIKTIHMLTADENKSNYKTIMEEIKTISNEILEEL